MFGTFAAGIGPPQVGWWFTGLVIVLGIVALTAVVILSGWSQTRSRRRSESTGSSLTKGMPKAA